MVPPSVTHPLTEENVAQMAQAGRGWWKVENKNNNVLKTVTLRQSRHELTKLF